MMSEIPTTWTREAMPFLGTRELPISMLVREQVKERQCTAIQ
jgi:hypothetical protein